MPNAPSGLVSGSAPLAEAVIASIIEAVVITAADPSGDQRIVFVNAAFTRMTGYGRAEIVGRRPRILQGVATSATARATMRDAIAKQRPATVEVRNYRKDGSEYIVDLTLAPVFDAAGACAHWVSVQRDITQRRSADEERMLQRIDAETRLAVLDERRERERMAERLAYTAEHDPLTGLYTRSHFSSRLGAAIATTKADPDAGYALLLIDLDRFRMVNEHIGHRKGDSLLRDLARRFERVAGRGDTLARLGGDEFGLLVDVAGSAADPAEIARLVLSELAACSGDSPDGLRVSASIGIVGITSEVDDPEVLLHDAETAAAFALRWGGGSFAVITPEMRAEAAALQRIRSDLPGAVDRCELRLFYQPLVDIALGRIYGFEGLARWKHPTRGLIGPDEFIPAAEEDGLIVDIGRWVLAEGCRKAVEFQDRSDGPLLMSLNVASAQLLDPRFYAHLTEVLQTTGLDPRTLQLEITETAFLACGPTVGAVFTRIRELGVKIAFDDFGTGYSSLSYLERYQIDSLKIDRSFVTRIHDASAKSEILRMIIALAHALGVEVIAEGVEHRTQRDALGHLGCTHLQGFLFSPPLPASDAMELLTPSLAASNALDTLLAETMVGEATLI